MIVTVLTPTFNRFFFGGAIKQPIQVIKETDNKKF